MKYCKNCGFQMPDEAKYCPGCGTMVDSISFETPSPAPAPVPYASSTTGASSGYANPRGGSDSYGNSSFGNNSPYAGPSGFTGQGYADPIGNPRPIGQLPTNRSLGKYFWLSLITFGIYGLVIMSGISSDINIVAGRYDGKKTMHYCLVFFLFSWLTLGILPLIWYTKLSNRIGAELRRRGIAYSFSAKHFWLWNILGSCIICGPFIYIHKLLTSMNLLCADYNVRG